MKTAVTAARRRYPELLAEMDAALDRIGQGPLRTYLELTAQEEAAWLKHRPDAFRVECLRPMLSSKQHEELADELKEHPPFYELHGAAQVAVGHYDQVISYREHVRPTRRSAVASQPEAVLGQYDIVFAKARCALEAMAVGAAVILCDFRGVGSMVTTGELERLRRLNFGHRALSQSHDPEVIAREIARYDAADAAEVSRRIRATAGLHTLVDDTLALYHEVLDEFAEAGAPSAEMEARAAAAYLRWVSEQWRAEQSQILSTLFKRIKHRLLRLPPLKATRSFAAQLRKLSPR